MNRADDSRFGRWTVVEELDPVIRISAGKKRTDRRVRVRCDCGTVSVVFLKHLRSGASQSCGCFSIERLTERRGENNPVRTHGLSGTRTYDSWRSMLGRCLNPNAPNRRYYGEAGVTVCERWRSFENFLADMGERPEGKTLDRIDPYGNYEPTNCRWATYREQRANQRARGER